MYDLAERIGKKIAAVENYYLNIGQEPGITLNSPLSVQAVKEVESRNSVTLPGDYVQFVTEFANGGFGPGNGLLALDESIEAARSLSAVVQQESCRIGGEFPITEVDWLRVSILEMPLQFDFPVDGMFPLCQWESGFIELLIVTGSNRGQVCRVLPDGNGEGRWLPCDDWKLCGFLEWYENWLSRCIPVASRSDWNDPEPNARLQFIKAGLGLGNKSITREAFLGVIRLFPVALELFYSSVDAILDRPIDRTEIERLMQDISKDQIRSEPYVLYNGSFGEIFARTDPWGNELNFDIYGPLGTPHCTKDRSTLHERIIDMVKAFGNAYLLNMDDEVDPDFLYKAMTGKILDWSADTPRLKT